MKSGSVSKCTGAKSAPAKGNGGVVVGVHLSRGAIRLAASRHGQILNFRHVMVPPNIAIDSVEFEALLRVTLREFCKPYGRVSVWAAVPLPGLSIRNLRVPKVSKQQLPLTVRWVLRRELSELPKETFVDFSVEGDVVDSGTRKIAVTACAVQKHDIDRVCALFAKVGFPLKGLTAPYFTFKNLIGACCTSESKGSCLYLDLGLESSQILLCTHGKVLVNREFRLGLGAFLDACMDEVPAGENAESFIAQLSDDDNSEGTSAEMDRAAVVDAFRPVLLRLMRQVDLTLESGTINLNEIEVSGIRLSGPLAACREVRDMISTHMGLPVSVFNPLSEHRVSRDLECDTPQTSASWFVPAVGLALSSDDGQTLNLLRPIQSTLERAERRNLNQRALIYFLVASLGVGCAWLGLRFCTSQLWRECDTLSDRIARDGDLLQEDSLRLTVNTLVSQYQECAAISSDRIVLAMMNEISMYDDAKIQLTDVEFKMVPLKDQVSSGGRAKKAGESCSVKLKGRVFGEHTQRAAYLAAYQIKLKSSPLFSQVSIKQSTSAIHSDMAVLQFLITITPDLQFGEGGSL